MVTDGLERWVLAKIQNSISACRSMMAINSRHRAHFRQRVSNLKLSERPLYDAIVRDLFSEKVFDDIDRMPNRVIGGIEALVRSVGVPEQRYNLSTIENGLTAYVRAWC